jgi:hypothetical protein
MPLNFQVNLEAASGRRYAPRSQNSSSAANTYLFPEVKETLKSIVVTATSVTSLPPVKLSAFHLGGATVPSGEPPIIALPKVTSRSGKRSEGGGVGFRVSVDGRPAPAGSLRLGMEKKTATGWSAIHWLQARVHTSGEVIVTRIPPGAFRFQRRYRPDKPLPWLSRGKWANETVTGMLKDGETTGLPPLQWVPKP